MLTTSKKFEVETRRQIERKLFSFGLTQQDVATALGIDTGSVAHDLKKIGDVQVVFDTTNLTNAQRRDKAFNCAFNEYFRIHDVSDYAKQLDVDQEVARGIVNALDAYLDMKRVDAIVEGIVSSIQILINPTDPPEYKPYRQFIAAIFGERMAKLFTTGFLTGFYSPEECIGLNRENLPKYLANYAVTQYRPLFLLPFDHTIKVAMDEVFGALETDRQRDIISLRFGLSGGKPLSHKEVADRLSITEDYIRQMEGKILRTLRHPQHTHRLRIFLESPSSVTRRTLEEMFPKVLPATPTPTMVYEGANIPNLDELLAKPVEELELSVRSYNALKNNSINTIGDLVQKTEGYQNGGMLSLKNFGRRSLNEIKELLEPLGLCFGMKLDGNVLRRPVPAPLYHEE